jgi:hypothetical protein
LAGVPAVAIVFALPPSVVQARNAARSARVVDLSVVDQHLARLDAALSAIPGESWASVWVLGSAADADGVRIVRTPPA